MQKLYIFFLACLSCEAILSLTEALLSQTVGPLLLLTSVRTALTLMVLLLSIPAYLGLGIFTNLKRRIWILPCLFPWLAFSLTFFFGPFTPRTGLFVFLPFVQLLIAMFAFMKIKGSPAIDAEKEQMAAGKMAFSVKRSLAFYLLSLFFLPPAFLALGFVSFAGSIEQSTKGYVSLGYDGIYSAAKLFERGDSRVKLVGMAHVGDADFYEDLKKSFAKTSALLLMEGVTDDKELLQNVPDYEFIAKNLGVEDQRAVFSPASMPENIEIIRADLDIQDFASSTVEALNLAGKLYSEDGFKLETIFELHTYFSKTGVTEAFLQDLLNERNRRVIELIKENLEQHALIIVPWGALHLPEIEDWLLENNFKMLEMQSRKLYSFKALFNKVFGS